MNFSISRIKQFKSCRRGYWFKYVQNLVPVEKAEPLVIGKNYHELIEWLNNHKTLDGVEEDNSKELAMANAYWKYIYPKFSVLSSEVKFSCAISDDDNLVGIIDALTKDGCIVEHKTVGSEINEQYEYNLLWDEQLLAYMYATGYRKAYYTICRKPTIRQKKDESDEAFYRRMVEWYDEDTEHKIKMLEIERTDSEVEAFAEDLKKIVAEIKSAEKNDVMYRNCGWCNVWGRRCEYSSICLNYDPNEKYIEFNERTEYENWDNLA